MSACTNEDCENTATQVMTWVISSGVQTTGPLCLDCGRRFWEQMGRFPLHRDTITITPVSV